MSAGSVFHSVDNETIHALTARSTIEIVRLTIANTEISDTQVLVNIFKYSEAGKTARITGYNTEIAGYEYITINNLILTAGQYLVITSSGKADIDINFKEI